MTRAERLTALKLRSEAGDTIDAMANLFRTSRGAISGALSRNGLKTQNRQPAGLVYALRAPTTFNNIARNPDKTKAREAKEARQRAAEAAEEEQAQAKAQPAWAALPGSRPRPLGEIRLVAECTWPLWCDNGVDEANQPRPDTEPHVFCGEPCIDRAYPYCKPHLRKAFKVLPPLLKPYGDDDGKETEPLPDAAGAEREELQTAV